MKRIFLSLLLLPATVLAMSLVFTGCPSVVDTTPEASDAARDPYPQGVLFLNEDYTYFIEHVDEPTGAEAFMVAGYGDSATVTITDSGTAVVTFDEYPAWWGGGAALAQRPVQLDPDNVTYDLSQVATISFEIKSNNVGLDEVSFGVQWDGPNYSSTNLVGGEKLLTLTELGITEISDWTEVTIDVSPGGDIPDTGTVRHDHTPISFHGDDGNTYVKVPLMMVWAGSDGTSPNAGPLTSGDSFEARHIAFLDADGEHVEIASAILQ